MNSVHAIQSIYEKVTPGADEEEHTTPIISLCHGFLQTDLFFHEEPERAKFWTGRLIRLLF